MNVELFVELVVTDNTAVTALATLHNQGFKEVKKLKRYDYYCFDVRKDDDLFSQLTKVDILVNAHKNRASKTISLEKDQAMIIVKDLENPGKGMLHTLTHRLGFQGINDVVKGIAWVARVEGNKKIVAKKITEQLLMNEHFQEAEYRFSAER